jgi:hypothetical protein
MAQAMGYDGIWVTRGMLKIYSKNLKKSEKIFRVLKCSLLKYTNSQSISALSLYFLEKFC